MNKTAYRVLVYFAISFCFSTCALWVFDDNVLMAIVMGLLGAFNINQLILCEIKDNKQ